MFLQHLLPRVDRRSASGATLSLDRRPREPPPGRGRLFAGIHGSIIIDESYNASPAAVEEALATLKAFPSFAKVSEGRPHGRKIAILGDMLELGRYSVAEHARIGALAGAVVDELVTVGVRARGIIDGARSAGMPDERMHACTDARSAALHLFPLLGEGDVVLVKGSQSNIRLERAVELLLADAQDCTRLVRQERQWLAR